MRATPLRIYRPGYFCSVFVPKTGRSAFRLMKSTPPRKMEQVAGRLDEGAIRWFWPCHTS
jgi:hypothetical protein